MHRSETPMEGVINYLMSGIVFYKSATIKRYDREVRILYLTPSFGESIEGKEYKLNFNLLSG